MASTEVTSEMAKAGSRTLNSSSTAAISRMWPSESQAGTLPMASAPPACSGVNWKVRATTCRTRASMGSTVMRLLAQAWLVTNASSLEGTYQQRHTKTYVAAAPASLLEG